MLILGIETSCDDTSIAVLRAEGEKIEVLANVVSSQIATHAAYGGIVPLLAAREHEKNLPIVLAEALAKASCAIEVIDLIAVTSGPGLIMSLVKGVNFAKELAEKNKKPLIGINHMEGHIYSNWLQAKEASEAISFPALCLIVSGGHTELVLMKNHGVYELIGRTVDDAAGEAFDKIARIIGLEYPGGPAISREADKHASELTNHESCHKFPRPMMHSKDFNFSFSGLKTSAFYFVRDLTKKGAFMPTPSNPPYIKGEGGNSSPLEARGVGGVVCEIAHEIQEAIVDVLISKTLKAAEQFQPKSILLAGGVSANKLLRQRLAQEVSALTPKTYYLEPPLQYTTDNAAMIATAAYFRTKRKADLSRRNFEEVKADANWEIA